MGDDGVKLVAQVAQVAGGLAGDDVGDGLEQALAVLSHPELAPLFGPGSRAEQPLTGTVGDVVVREGGCENLTRVPREVSEVEAVMAGAPWGDGAAR